jgi:hypothetical protein
MIEIRFNVFLVANPRVRTMRNEMVGSMVTLMTLSVHAADLFGDRGTATWNTPSFSISNG